MTAKVTERIVRATDGTIKAKESPAKSTERIPNDGRSGKVTERIPNDGRFHRSDGKNRQSDGWHHRNEGKPGQSEGKNPERRKVPPK